jgi:transcription initiation factor TFIIE subunit alpha
LSLFVSHDVLSKVVEMLGGEDAIRIVSILQKADKLTDEELSNKTEIRLNEVRKILYRLYDYSLVTCERLRDENTGWFIFYWKLQPDQAEGFIMNQKRKILEKLESRLNYETSHNFYSCLTEGCDRVTFEDAMETLFRCQKCGKPLKHVDNSEIIEHLREKINSIHQEFESTQ